MALNVNGLNASIKRLRVTDEKTKLTYVLPTRHSPQS